MSRRQTMPRQWLIIHAPLGAETWRSLSSLPRGSGVVVLGKLTSAEQPRLRRVAHQRALVTAAESTAQAARVHSVRELRRARLRGTPLILLSPLYATSSHPDWLPIPRMRAAALARLGGRRLVALGGMDARRFRAVERLGFQAWAGISAFRI